MLRALVCLWAQYRHSVVEVPMVQIMYKILIGRFSVLFTCKRHATGLPQPRSCRRLCARLSAARSTFRFLFLLRAPGFSVCSSISSRAQMAGLFPWEVRAEEEELPEKKGPKPIWRDRAFFGQVSATRPRKLRFGQNEFVRSCSLAIRTSRTRSLKAVSRARRFAR